MFCIQWASHNQILNKSGKREQAYATEKGRSPFVSLTETARPNCNETTMLMVLGQMCTRRTTCPCPCEVCSAGQSLFWLVCSVRQEIIFVIQLLCNIYHKLIIYQGNYLHRWADWHVYLGQISLQEIFFFFSIYYNYHLWFPWFISLFCIFKGIFLRFKL